MYGKNMGNSFGLVCGGRRGPASCPFVLASSGIKRKEGSWGSGVSARRKCIPVARILCKTKVLDAGATVCFATGLCSHKGSLWLRQTKARPKDVDTCAVVAMLTLENVWET